MNKIIEKTRLYLFIVLALGFLFSCNEDELKEVVYSELTTDIAFVTSNDAKAAINGTYEPLIAITRTPIFYLNDMSTDDCYREGWDYEILNDANLNIGEAVITSWDRYYKIVGRTNVAIDNIPNINNLQFGATDTLGQIEKDKLIAEAYFMRGFAYYQLTDIFYTVPLVVSSTVAVDSKLPPAKIDDIEAQIASDLTKAASHLPEKWSNQLDAGRATKGAALGMLCRLHMRAAGRARLKGGNDAAEWQKALTYANQVLDMETRGIYSLQPNVWDIYDPERDESIYNNEIIFAVRASGTITTGSSDIGLMFTPWEYDMGWNLFSIPLELVWKFNKNDDRYKLLVTHFDDVYNNPKYYTIPDSVELTGSKYQKKDTAGNEVIELDAAYTTKYKYTKTGTYNYNTNNNMNIMRLADIILCKAEILNELNGPNQTSIDLINRIRERAFHNSNHNLSISDYATKDDLRSAICDERLFELNNEGVRRPDLIRMGLWKDRLEKYIAGIKLKSEYKSTNSGHASDYFSSMWKVYPNDLTENDLRRYYPAPKRETDLNPELKNCRNF